VSVCAGKIVACIGPVTAATARAAGLHVDVVAGAFTIDGLVRALDNAVSA
jgi:uroporphyrinogen III methyltransferase/synthase